MIYITLPNGQRVGWLFIALGVGGVFASIVGLGVSIFAQDLLPKAGWPIMFVFLLALSFTMALPLPAVWRVHDAQMTAQAEEALSDAEHHKWSARLFKFGNAGRILDGDPEATVYAQHEPTVDRDVTLNDKKGKRTVAMTLTPEQQKRVDLVGRWKVSLSRVCAWGMAKGGLRVADLVGPSNALSYNNAHTVVTDELAKMGIVSKANGSTTALKSGLTYAKAIAMINDPTSEHEFPDTEPPTVRQLPDGATLPKGWHKV